MRGLINLIQKKHFHPFHYLLCVCWILPLASDGAITGPKLDASSVRLSTKPKINNNRIDIGSEIGDEESSRKQNYNSHSDVTIKIVEPKNMSYIKGGNFHVAVQIQPTSDVKAFRHKYLESEDGRVCVSLDNSAFHCWPINDGRIYFSQAIEGSHTIVAMLFNNGKLQGSSKSEAVNFTTVNDPNIEIGEEDENFNLKATQEIDEEIFPEEVNVTFPVLQVVSPAEKVSYTGTSIIFRSNIEPDDEKQFEKYFSKSFRCFNIDISTAYACFPIFGDKIDPFVLGLKNGMHTIDAALSHPQTGDLLDKSNQGTRIFLIAGNSNEGALFTVDINIRGESYIVPVVKGGCIARQSQAFCESLGLTKNKKCTEPVLQHLREVAESSALL